MDIDSLVEIIKDDLLKLGYAFESINTNLNETKYHIRFVNSVDSIRMTWCTDKGRFVSYSSNITTEVLSVVASVMNYTLAKG